MPSIHPNDRIIVEDERERGWTRNRDVENRIVRLLHNQSVPMRVEGIFTCEIEEDPESPIFLAIYYRSESTDCNSHKVTRCDLVLSNS